MTDVQDVNSGAGTDGNSDADSDAHSSADSGSAALLARFERAARAADTVISAVGPEQWDDPTPCTEWTVRQLVNHLVGGAKGFVALLSGGEGVDRASDFLGDDPAGAFRSSARELGEAFAADGVLARIVPTPFGERPAAVLATMRTTEMMVHGWDVAKATGQSTDLEPELARRCAAELREMLGTGRGSGAFAAEQPVPEDATAADRMAAVAGRAVS